MEWTELPSIEPCFFGDGRVVQAPLQAWHCMSCGLRRGRVDADLEASVFASYDLSALAGTSGARRARGARFAEWVLDAVLLPDGGHLTDVGCGGGALLEGVRSLRPDVRVSGWEPSGPAVRRARDAGLPVHHLAPGETPATNGDHDVVVSVNVLEHVPDPVGFLRALAAMLRARGTIVLVVPDGGAPGPDMLVADHRRSLSATAVHHLAGHAGLRVEAGPDPSPGLGGFVRFTLVRGPARPCLPGVPPGLARDRERYLHAWSMLDTRLDERVATTGALALFGGGEAALMLRLYAPRVFARAEVIFQDQPVVDSLLGLPCRALTTGVGVRPRLVLALQPHLHRRLGGRLRGEGWDVVEWADLLHASDSNPSTGGAA